MSNLNLPGHNFRPVYHWSPDKLSLFCSVNFQKGKNLFPSGRSRSLLSNYLQIEGSRVANCCGLHFCEIHSSIYITYLAKINMVQRWSLTSTWLVSAGVNFSIFYGVCDTLKLKFWSSHVFGIWLLFSSLAGSTCKTLGMTLLFRFWFFVIHRDPIIQCFHYRCLESINLIFIIECC